MWVGPTEDEERRISAPDEPEIHMDSDGDGLVTSTKSTVSTPSRITPTRTATACRIRMTCASTCSTLGAGTIR